MNPVRWFSGLWQLLIFLFFVGFSGCGNFSASMPILSDHRDVQTDTRLEAERLVRQIHQDYLSQRLYGGLVPLSAIAGAQNNLASIAMLDKGLHVEIRSILLDEEQKTRREIARLKHRLAELEPSDEAGLVFEKMLQLHSPDPENPLRRPVETRGLDTIYLAGEEAFLSGRWKVAETAFRLVDGYRSGYRSVDERIEATRQSRRREQLVSAVNQANLDRVLSILDEMENEIGNGTFKSGMGGDVVRVAGFLAQQAVTAERRGNIDDAAILYLQGRQLAERYDPAFAVLSRDESAFLDRLVARARQEMAYGRPGHALGYLLHVEDVNPEYPGLDHEIRDLWKTIAGQSVRRITVLDFESPETGPGTGQMLSARLFSHLFENAIGDFRLVNPADAGKLPSDSICSMRRPSAEWHADTLITGRVSDFHVDRTLASAREIRQEVTGSRLIENPAFSAWMKLDANQRKGIPKPPETVTAPVEKEVEYSAWVHRITGALSVSIRLVDINFSRTLWSDTITVRQDYEDWRTAASNTGDDALPPEEDIVEDLVDEASGQIGRSIIRTLTTVRPRYLDAAGRLYADGALYEATEAMAGAYVLGEAQGLRKRLKAFLAASHKNRNRFFSDHHFSADAR